MARKVSAADFVAFLKERLAAKDGYIFGATGQDPKKLPERYFARYDGKQRKKALYWRERAERVWDCNGLAEGFYKDRTGSSINARARDNYASWCDPRGEGKIPARYRVPGAAVFKRSSYIHHVGFLVQPVNPKKPGGDWYVIEARSVMTGVIRSRLNGNDWDCWGLMTKYFDYGTVASAPDAGAQQAKPAGRALRLGDRGENVRKLQRALIRLGVAPEGSKPNGVYGESTAAAVRALQRKLGLEEDGIYGEATHAALARVYEDAEGKAAAPGERVQVTGGSVNLRGGPGTEYPKQGTVHRGDVLEVLEQAENGWRNVQADGQTGWISPKMCEVFEEVIKNG